MKTNFKFLVIKGAVAIFVEVVEDLDWWEADVSYLTGHVIGKKDFTSYIINLR